MSSGPKLVVYKNGDFALGEFDANLKRDGKVTYQSTRGDFAKNSRQGHGNIKFDFDDTVKFDGEYDIDRKNGYGKFVSPEGSIEGNFVDGILEGYGRSVNPEGHFYEGFFKNSLKDGYGLEVLSNSDCYFGEFYKDRKEGIGLYLFAKGGYYYGFFKNNEKHDYGILYSKVSHAFYFGEFRGDRKHGRGIEVLKDGSFYNGIYELNKRAGPGIMEYANKSVYMGEWSNGQRSGKGRMEGEGKVVSGNWQYDKIKMLSAVNLDEIMKPIYDQKLPASFEAYYKTCHHRFTEFQVPEITLNANIRPILVNYLKLRTAKGEIRGHIYRKINYIIDNSRALLDISERVYQAFTRMPDHHKIFSPIGPRVPSRFQSGDYKIRWFGISFDNKKRETFIFDHLIVSNDVIYGFGTDDRDYTLDGICLPEGCAQIYQKYRSGKEDRSFTCVAGPNYFAGIDNEETKICLIPDLDMWKGYYFRNDMPQEKPLIVHYLRIYDDDKIYGFGRDKIGIFCISGQLREPSGSENDRRKIAEFDQIYEKNYCVEFTGRFDGEEIRGEWKSAPLEGKFMLKINQKYNVKSLNSLIKNSRDSGVNERVTLQNTILSNILLPVNREKPQSSVNSVSNFDDTDSTKPKFNAKDLAIKDEVSDEIRRSLARSKSSLFAGDKSIYDSYRELLHDKFFQSYLKALDNLPSANTDLFATGEESLMSGSAYNKDNRKSPKRSAFDNKRSTLRSQPEDEMESPKLGSKKKSKTSTKVASNQGSPESVEKEHVPQNVRELLEREEKERENQRRMKRIAMENDDPRRLIPYWVDDRTSPEEKALLAQKEYEEIMLRKQLRMEEIERNKRKKSKSRSKSKKRVVKKKKKVTDEAAFSTERESKTPVKSSKGNTAKKSSTKKGSSRSTSRVKKSKVVTTTIIRRGRPAEQRIETTSRSRSRSVSRSTSNRGKSRTSKRSPSRSTSPRRSPSKSPSAKRSPSNRASSRKRSPRRLSPTWAEREFEGRLDRLIERQNETRTFSHSRSPADGKKTNQKTKVVNQEDELANIVKQRYALGAPGLNFRELGSDEEDDYPTANRKSSSYRSIVEFKEIKDDEQPSQNGRSKNVSPQSAQIEKINEQEKLPESPVVEKQNDEMLMNDDNGLDIEDDDLYQKEGDGKSLKRSAQKREELLKLEADQASKLDKVRQEEFNIYKNKVRDAAEEEAHLDDYKSIVRRVNALMSYKPDPFSINQEANLQRTDVPRIMKANFDFKEDKDLLKLLQRMELATIKQAERESPIEIAWRGTIEAYGKKQPFLIEHLFPAKGGFRGSMVYDDKFFALTGEFLPTEDETNDHLPFELEAFHERTFAYRLKGRFVGYDIELRMERISKTFSIPLTMRLTCKSTPCTVFMEPYKSLYPGRAKISDLLYVVFYNNGKLNLISGKLNSLGVFVGQLIRDGMVGEPPILRQTKNPKRTGKALAVTLLDEKNQIGYVIEMHPNK